MNSLHFSHILPYETSGKLISVQGTTVTVELPFARLGDIIKIETSERPVLAQVVSFTEQYIIASPLGTLRSVSPGARVSSTEDASSFYLTSDAPGSLHDAFGEIIVKNKNGSECSKLHDLLPEGRYSLFSRPKKVDERQGIREKLHTGIRSLDTHTTLGKGQRIVILAEPGVGKSSLLLSLAEHVEVDLVVVALIGERGREVSEFYQELSESSAANRTILIASTSDEPAPVRAQAAETAMRIAEIAAENGANVLLAFDSLTRYLRSLRDIGLSAGELPIRRGYPASVFEKIPALIERAGKFSAGSITGVYTMLSSSDFDEDPLVEEVKGLTDGHIILSRALAEQGHFPAIDIRKSLSRLQRRFWDKEVFSMIQDIKAKYAELIESRDLLMISQNHNRMNENEEKLTLIKNFLIQGSETFIGEEELLLGIERLHSSL